MALNGGLSSDGKVHFRSLEEAIQLWDMATRQPIGAPLPTPGGTFGAEFSVDGKALLTIAADHQTARLWDATTGVALGPVLRMPSEVLNGTLSPDGKALLFVGKDQTVWIADSGTGTIRGRTQLLGGTAYAAWFSPDGKTFFTGLDNGEVWLWDAATVTPLGDPISNPGGIGTGLFSPDGKSLLIACEDASIRLWDLATRKLRIPPIRGHQGPVYGRAFSPDGQTLATGSQDKTVRLWDLATGQSIGPILRHQDSVGVEFRDDGKTLFTQSGRVSRLFGVAPELPDELERVATWVEVMTGLRLDKQQGLVQVLDNATWLKRREQLMQLGGPPEPAPDQRLDPILFGPDPTARAKSFLERKQWDAAEAAFDEAMRARPFNMSIVVERGDLYARRGLWKEAAAYYATAVEQHPDYAPLHSQLAIARLIAGDLAGYRSACTAMLERFKTATDLLATNRLAYACIYAPESVPDMPTLIQVCERSVQMFAGGERVVGAALYRAGRLEEALQRLEQAHKVFQPRAWDWLFLAMIHSRLGHTREAQRSLQQAEQWIVEADNAPSGTETEGARWSNLTERPTILLLRLEAEALLSADANFPADPFAP
jgi:Flp pilus assembly protein TadD